MKEYAAISNEVAGVVVVQNTPALVVEVAAALGNRPSGHHPLEVVAACAVGAHLHMMEGAPEAVRPVEEAF
jgi:hypothetical protein